MSYQQEDEAYEDLVFSIFQLQPRGVDEKFIMKKIRELVGFRMEKEDEVFEKTMDKISELMNEEIIREERKKYSGNLNPSQPNSPPEICWSLTGRGLKVIRERTENKRS